MGRTMTMRKMQLPGKEAHLEVCAVKDNIYTEA